MGGSSSSLVAKGPHLGSMQRIGVFGTCGLRSTAHRQLESKCGSTNKQGTFLFLLHLCNHLPITFQGGLASQVVTALMGNVCQGCFPIWSPAYKRWHFLFPRDAKISHSLGDVRSDSLSHFSENVPMQGIVPALQTFSGVHLSAMSSAHFTG